MALATTNANVARQKVYSALSNATGTTAGSGDPSAWYAFKAFFLNMAASKGNPDLQFYAFNATDAVAGDGEDTGIDAACKLYAFYVKKTATTTDTWFRIIDDADNDSEVVGDVLIQAALIGASDIHYGFYPNGLAIADGIAITFTTTPGDTATQSSAGDAGNGFFVVGAP